MPSISISPIVNLGSRLLFPATVYTPDDMSYVISVICIEMKKDNLDIAYGMSQRNKNGILNSSITWYCEKQLSIKLNQGEVIPSNLENRVLTGSWKIPINSRFWIASNIYPKKRFGWNIVNQVTIHKNLDNPDTIYYQIVTESETKNALGDPSWEVNLLDEPELIRRIQEFPNENQFPRRKE